jgi:hypothetical protein
LEEVNTAAVLLRFLQLREREASTEPMDSDVTGNLLFAECIFGESKHCRSVAEVFTVKGARGIDRTYGL